MNEIKEKDRILAEIKALRPISEISGLDQYLPDLEQDGYVKVKYILGHKPWNVRLTTTGESFLKNGGYKAQAKRAVMKGTSKSALRIIEPVAGGFICAYCGWLLRGCAPEDSTAPSSAEPIEQLSVMNDSTRLSSSSELLLNDDSVAMRAKSLTDTSDSSAKTRRIDSTLTPVIMKSAEQSSRADTPSSASSGK